MCELVRARHAGDGQKKTKKGIKAEREKERERERERMRERERSYFSTDGDLPCHRREQDRAHHAVQRTQHTE